MRTTTDLYLCDAPAWSIDCKAPGPYPERADIVFEVSGARFIADVTLAQLRRIFAESGYVLQSYGWPDGTGSPSAEDPEAFTPLGPPDMVTATSCEITDLVSVRSTRSYVSTVHGQLRIEYSIVEMTTLQLWQLHRVTGHTLQSIDHDLEEAPKP